MSRTHTILFGALFIFIVGGFVYQLKSEDAPPTKIDEEQMAQRDESSTLPEQKNEEGPVSVTITPVSVETPNTWDFEITFQTHSIELDMDVLEAVVLIDASGAEIKPLSWDGDGPKGHHRAGTMRFPALDPTPETVTIRVKDIADVPLREFKW